MNCRCAPKWLLAAAMLAFAAPAKSQPLLPSAEVEPYLYYVDFRVAENGAYGHSYIAYGRLNAAGKPVSAAYADIHPTGEFLSLVVGHFLPIDATTQPSRETIARHVSDHYMRPL